MYSCKSGLTKNGNKFDFGVIFCRALQGDKMPEQLPEELSREKVPGALSKAPKINGSAPPRVRAKISGTSDRFYLFVYCPCVMETNSISKHTSNSTYIQFPKLQSGEKRLACESSCTIDIS